MKRSISFLATLFLFSMVSAQNRLVNLSGVIRNSKTKEALPFVNVVLKTPKDSAFVSGTVSDEEGRFTLPNIKNNSYILGAHL
jgi:YbbR domain-containing protein